MTSTPLLIGGAVLLLFFGNLVLGKRGPSLPPQPPRPGGPEQLGDLRTYVSSKPMTPMRDADAVHHGLSGGSSPFDPSASLTSAQSDELSKLDSLRNSGTLTEKIYQDARARVLGISTEGWSVTVLSAGPNKIKAIKVVRECRRDLGLKDAKDFVDALPQVLFIGLSQADAARVKQWMEQAGVAANIGQRS